MKNKVAILLGKKGTTLVNITDSQVSNSSGEYVLSLNDDASKLITLPKEMTILTSGLSPEEINNLAAQLSGNNPVNHFSISSEYKTDLNDMLSEKQEEKVEKPLGPIF